MPSTIRSTRRACGFTLVELVITITIIGIIAAIAMPRMARSQEVRQSFNAASAIQGQFSWARERAMATGRPQGVAFFAPWNTLDPQDPRPASIVVYDNVKTGQLIGDANLVRSFMFDDPIRVNAVARAGSTMPGFGASAANYLPMIDVNRPSASDSFMVFDAYGQPNAIRFQAAATPGAMQITACELATTPMKVQFSVPGGLSYRFEILPLSAAFGPTEAF